MAAAATSKNPQVHLPVCIPFLPGMVCLPYNDYASDLVSPGKEDAK
jgi:hypothetical protein